MWKQFSFSERRQWQLVLLGYLHWFFGNFYELMVFTPNVAFAKSIPNAIRLIQQFWSVAEPPWYFLPWNPLTILLTCFLCVKQWKKVSVAARKYFAMIFLASVFIALVTAYIIVNINTKFYFREIRLPDSEIIDNFWVGFYLGNIRLLLELLLIYCTAIIIYKKLYPHR